ncbi:MAG: hypothetical protein IPJ01_11405 [Micavibrio sp.]|nr:hypothetical protein [Micavibrio sp.]
MEKIPKYIIKSFKDNGEFMGYLSAYSASGLNQFAPQITQAILFDKEEDCIYSNRQTWEFDRSGVKGYYEIEKLIQYNNKDTNDLKIYEKKPTPMKELSLFLEKTIDNSNNKDEQRFLGGVLAVISTSYLRSEEKVIVEAYDKGYTDFDFGHNMTGKDYYKENFK